MRLSEIARTLGVEPVTLDVDVTGICLNSATVESGDLFLALPGERTHGIRFADDAAARGAVAVLTDRAGAAMFSALPVIVVEDPRQELGDFSSWFFGDPSEQMSVMGITGTNGKTTTTFMIEAACRGAGSSTGLIGTIQTQIAGEVQPSVRTTPEAPDLQKLFARMVKSKVSHVAMEVSSHALALGRVAGTHFAVAGFTNLSQDHLDFHADMEDYFRAKASLFDSRYTENAVINIDDEYGRRLIEEVSVPSLALSTRGEADWSASDIRCTSTSSTARVVDPYGRSYELSLHIPGRYNVDNALMALAVASSTGLDTAQLVSGLNTLVGVPGRMEYINEGQDFSVIVDYAHTPEAVTRLFEEVRAITQGRVIGVLGCGGDRDVAKRPLMGRAVANGCDVAILTSDNPRSEDPLVILTAMEAGAREGNHQLMVEADRRTAIEQAIALAKPGDAVVIAGKGHEQGQEINGLITPFDDRKIARDVLRMRLA